MALEKVGGSWAGWFKTYTKEKYERKKEEILASCNPRTERISNGMIYCNFCHDPKIFDCPERNFITKCCCGCEVDRYERQRNMSARPPRVKEVRQGDWNPFDRGAI